MSLWDSIIASTAILLNESILTNNTSGFSHLTQVKIIDLKQFL